MTDIRIAILDDYQSVTRRWRVGPPSSATPHPFRRLETVVATPHLGYVSRRQYDVWYGDTVAHVAAWLESRAGTP